MPFALTLFVYALSFPRVNCTSIIRIATFILIFCVPLCLTRCSHLFSAQSHVTDENLYLMTAICVCVFVRGTCPVHSPLSFTPCVFIVKNINLLLKRRFWLSKSYIQHRVSIQIFGQIQRYATQLIQHSFIFGSLTLTHSFIWCSQ